MENNNTSTILNNSKEQFNILLGNMFQFQDEDMDKYDRCYRNVFKQGLTFSYMSSTFFAQFASEILVGALSSNPFRRFLTAALDAEAARTEPGRYWNPDMNTARFGRPGYDYTTDIKDVIAMMNESYIKILSMNEWYGTDEGKQEFEMHCLSNRAVNDLKRMVLEFPYLIRRYDWDEDFAGEIMEYAGVVAEQIRRAAEEQEDGKK